MAQHDRLEDPTPPGTAGWGAFPILQGRAQADRAPGRPDLWGWAIRVSIVGLFVIAVGMVLYTLGHVIVPLVLAWVFATMLLPIVDGLSRRGVPRPLAALAVTFALLLVIALLLAILTVPASYWVGRADELGDLLRQKFELVRRPLDMLEHLGAAVSELSSRSSGPSVRVDTGSGMMGAIFGVLTPLVDEVLILVVALVFHLIYQKEIQNAVVELIDDPDLKERARRILRDIQRNMTLFFGTIAVINVAMGAAISVIVYALGYPHPLLWGVLAAVLNFVPYLGPLIVMGVLFVAGIVVSNSVGHALVAPAAFLALNVLEAHVVTPALVGHRLTINPFMLFVSLAFWTWMWGPVGAFVATPLLMSVLVTTRHLGTPTAAEDPVPRRQPLP